VYSALHPPGCYDTIHKTLASIPTDYKPPIIKFMNIKAYLNLLIINASISSILFFIIGYAFTEDMIDYDDWTLVILIAQIIISFAVFLPMLAPFILIDKYINVKGKYFTSKKIFIKTILAAIYITSLFWFSIFQDAIKSDDTYNFYATLKYLGLSGIIGIICFPVISYFSKNKFKTLANKT